MIKDEFYANESEKTKIRHHVGDLVMAARLFLSCSQDKNSPEEMKAVKLIKEKLYEEFNFIVHVAVEENYFNGNPHLLENLNESDYFVFIDFERPIKEKNIFKRFFLSPSTKLPISIYSHQELAMAIALGFDKTNMLIFAKKGLYRYGLLGNMFVNAEFSNYSDIVNKVIVAVRQKAWSAAYSRMLIPFVKGLNNKWAKWGDKYSHPRKDGLCQNREFRRECIALVAVTNHRKDIAARNCIVHLKSIEGDLVDFLDPAPIKAAGINGYSHTIWPDQTVDFDLFSYDIDKKKIFMHTECDVTDENGCRRPLIKDPGCYTLTYEIYAEHFPVSTFQVKIQLGHFFSDITVNGKPLAPVLEQNACSSGDENTLFEEGLVPMYKQVSYNKFEAPQGTGFSVQ